MRRYWVPLLTTDTPPELVDLRTGSALGGIKVVLLNNAEPVKLIIYMIPVIILAMTYVGLYQSAETQRKIAIENEAIARKSEAIAVENQKIANEQKVEAEKQRNTAEGRANLAMDALLSEEVVKAAEDPKTRGAIAAYIKENQTKTLENLGLSADAIQYRKYKLLKEVIGLDKSPPEMLVRARSDRFTLMYEALEVITTLAKKTGNEKFIQESTEMNAQYWDEVCQAPGIQRLRPPCSD